jgi:beta-1,4-N-acetylglucosaminyltransferase
MLVWLLADARVQAILDFDAIETIPRSREVGQSWISTVWTTLVALLSTVRMVLHWNPRVLVVNGPGTCVPVVLAVWLWRFAGICRSRVVFVESACRVETLSLTGRLMYMLLADRVLVQWPSLLAKYPQVEHVGISL